MVIKSHRERKRDYCQDSLQEKWRERYLLVRPKTLKPSTVFGPPKIAEKCLETKPNCIGSSIALYFPLPIKTLEKQTRLIANPDKHHLSAKTPVFNQTRPRKTLIRAKMKHPKAEIRKEKIAEFLLMKNGLEAQSFQRNLGIFFLRRVFQGKDLTFFTSSPP